VFRTSLQLLSETFIILRTVQRDIINVRRSSCKVPVISFQILMKIQLFFRQILEKYSNIKFHENPSSGSRVVSRGQTDGHYKANRFSQFCEGALK